MKTPCTLLILDGYGISPQVSFNAIREAHTPFLDYWMGVPGKHSLLEAAGAAVGLPTGQIGNSEVGHLHIGAGRRLLQGLPLINAKLAEPELLQKTALMKNMLQRLQQSEGHIHLLGLLSEGGVHSHENHIFHIAKCLQNCPGMKALWVHAILDGRDVPPKSALKSIERFQTLQKQLPPSSPPLQLASVMGRFYAMDRDQRWERTEKAYQGLIYKNYDYFANSAQEAIAMAYQRGETDEFCQPTQCADFKLPSANDFILFMNFRADRARQLSLALAGLLPAPPPFATVPPALQPHLMTFTEYDDTLAPYALFPQEIIKMTLGEVLAKANLKQLRISETEKFAHVTYFLNGNRREPFEGESRCLIPSNRSVKTYDLDPPMQCFALAQKVEEAIQSQSYDAIICNFPNADMVGHTGNYRATLQSLEALDQALASIAAMAQSYHHEILITADHGNAENMFDEGSHQPQTAHTSSPVPLIHVNHQGPKLRPKGSLADVAPTFLELLGLEKPESMQGQSLWTRE